ncbi:Maintenance of ploidy protein mob2 [Cladochytrium tenue]|nr:Maintenance of ploidy protein mob2 [Cladochytrium tenue]
MQPIANYRQISALPRHMDENECSEAFDFFNYTNIFYNVFAEFCTAESCPTMSAGPGYEYTWTDSQRRTVRLPAPQYVDYIMTWTQNVLNDQATFPTSSGAEFPRDFRATVKAVFRQLLRVVAHLYAAHGPAADVLAVRGHLDVLAAHLVAFVREFDLLDARDVAPLLEAVDEAHARRAAAAAAAAASAAAAGDQPMFPVPAQ